MINLESLGLPLEGQPSTFIVRKMLTLRDSAHSLRKAEATFLCHKYATYCCISKMATIDIESSQVGQKLEHALISLKIVSNCLSCHKDFQKKKHTSNCLYQHIDSEKE